MLFLVLACPYIDEASVQARIDADGDGLVAIEWEGTDCDDADADIGVATEFFVDADGDTFGSTESVLACNERTGVVANSSDCDDTNLAISPDSVESCATVDVDDDCDGLADLADDSVADTITVFTDSDVDGFGGDGTGESACEAAGRALESGDCNDDDAAVHPGAVEVCLDGVDNDCDNSLDECTAGQITTWIRPDGTLQGVGLRIVGNFDLNEDGIVDIGIPAPYRVGAYILSSDQLTPGSLFDGSTSRWDFETFRPAGGYDFVAGPIGPEGVVGLVASSPSYDDGPGWGSALLVVEDAPSAGVFEHEWVLEGEGYYDALGISMDARDIDGDGQLDILAGAPYGDSGCGVAYLFYTPFGETGDSVDDFYNSSSEARATRFSGTCNGAALNDAFGSTVVLLGGGGEHGAVAGGAPASEFAGKMVGSVAVWEIGPETEDTALNLDSASMLIYGEDDYDGFGEALAAGDYNGDGIDDLAAGAAHAVGDVDNAGAAYVFMAAATLRLGTTRASQAEVTIHGPDRSTPPDGSPLFGFALALAGDMNGDGYDDLAVGAPDQAGINNQEHAGAVWVCAGSPAVGILSAGLACSGRINDEEDHTHLGWSIEYGGDIDGDARDELLVGMPGFRSSGLELGQVGIWYGADL